LRGGSAELSADFVVAVFGFSAGDDADFGNQTLIAYANFHDVEGIGGKVLGDLKGDTMPREVDGGDFDFFFGAGGGGAADPRFGHMRFAKASAAVESAGIGDERLCGGGHTQFIVILGWGDDPRTGGRLLIIWGRADAN